MSSFPRSVLRSPILSVSRHSRHFAGVALPIIGCFETPEACASVMHPYIECFATLRSTEFGVSKHWISKLVLHSLLLSVSKHLEPIVVFTELFKITFHVQRVP